MNAQSDLDVIRAGADAYQNFTTNTAGKYGNAPLIQGMQWHGRQAIDLPMREDSGPGIDASQLMRLGYLIGKLCGEAGEVSEKYWKFIRDTEGSEVASQRGALLLESEEVRKGLVAELGDVQWYIAQIARQLDTSLGDVMVENLKKLRSRAARGVLGGSGDVR